MNFQFHVNFILKGREGSRYNIELAQVPSCDCPFFSANTNNTCKHIIFILLNECCIQPDNKIMWQRSYTNAEARKLVEACRNTSHSACRSREGTSVESYSAGTNAELWLLTKLPRQSGQKPKCCACKRVTFNTGDLHVAKKGLYVTPQNNVVDRTYRFCATTFCTNIKPNGSNLVTPPDIVTLDVRAGVTEEEIRQVRQTGLNVNFN